jgi:preprotein translocase SecE subunit
VVDEGAVRPRRWFEFIGEIAGELGKVTWPSREATMRLTAFVIGIAVAIGLFLGLWDAGFGQAASRFLF